MLVDFAAGSLIVLGILVAVLGLFAGGSIVIASVGLASILAGGLLSHLGSHARPA